MYSPHTITIFNAYKVDKQQNYQPTRIDGVFKQGNRKITVGAQGTVKAGSAKVFIPLSAVAQDERVYIPPEDFKRLAEADRAKHWTLNEKGDFFIVGSYQQPDDGRAVRFDDIRDAYSSAHKVLEVNFCDYGTADLRHWEVLGE